MQIALKQLTFSQVDVFTAVPFKGNPVAVVLDADDLTTSQMQSIANWTNLSETTFVCTPTHPSADYRLRIFTPRSELPFAGHPTLGSAWAILNHGLRPKQPGLLVQECAKGLVSLRESGDSVFFALPDPAFEEMPAKRLNAVAEALGVEQEAVVESSIIDVGAVWITLQLGSAARVLDLDPDMVALALVTGDVTGVTVFGLYPQGGDSDVEVRSFAPGLGAPEDPVCGSGNGCVAAMIRERRILDVSGYTASQGQRLGRDGHVRVEFADDAQVWLGGNAVVCIEGTIST